MTPFTQVARKPVALTLAVMLAACGGGGGSSDGGGGTPPPVLTPACEISIVADANVAAGKTAGASAVSLCSAYISSIAWTQVSGPATDLLARRNTTVALETGTPGVIRLRADATLSDGRSSSATTDITVGAQVSGSFVTVRADHSLRVGTETSVRAWPVLAGGEKVSKIVWTRLDNGPAVAMNTTDQNVLIFTAPEKVDFDTALKFRATMTTTGGKTDTDDVIVTVDRQAALRNGYLFKSSARVHPYVAGGAYSNVLARCAYDVGLYYDKSGADTNLCPSSTLPLLQADAGAGVPTVAQVMSRVLVSHDFLGANFERFLTTQDVHGDFRRLLGATTAIVIGSHVRPSFYQPATGAIYLDANYLWLTPEQRDVVTEVPDFRLTFDDQLNFTGLARQVKNNDYARPTYDPEQRITRPEGDLIFGLGRLMYHELAHAGDFFAPAARNLNPAQSIYANLVPRVDNRLLPSDDLAVAYPLLSAQMKALGQVMYIGVAANAEQKAYTAAQVGSFFASDVASDDYAYSIAPKAKPEDVQANPREDLAMLFEEFMMAHRHGIQYDVAYTNLFKDGMSSSDLIVAWGQRGRVGSPAIKPRVKLVLARIAPWINASAVDALPAPQQMRVGASWDANLVLGSGLNGAPQPARLSYSLAEKRQQAREDVAGRRHAR